ncbi:MAG TPA: polyprenyl synthetase family protein [Oceanobacillus sp.]|nr:polyprenyl synthetase family protein [Oceanobacillus sp.]
MQTIARRYLSELDTTMRQVVETRLAPTSTEAPEFGTMLRYPLGWVDEHNQPFNQPTGKRIRPLLLLLCTEAVGGDWRKALPAAAAVELLHNFSLIHDDIQDDSPTRHNRPTVWTIWGRSNAINAGDALFALSYAALEGLADMGLVPEVVLKVWSIFNQTNLELTRGQHLDMRFERQTTVTTDEYLSMIRGKSAALVSACAAIGALIGSGDEEVAQHFGEFGLNLGISFQVRDDILGIWGDTSITGKSAATDILSRKKSLPVLYGLSQSNALVELYQREPFSHAEVDQAVAILNEVGALEFTQETETRYYQAALDALERANPQGEAAAGLVQLTESLFGRQA